MKSRGLGGGERMLRLGVLLFLDPNHQCSRVSSYTGKRFPSGNKKGTKNKKRKNINACCFPLVVLAAVGQSMILCVSE